MGLTPRVGSAALQRSKFLRFAIAALLTTSSYSFFAAARFERHCLFDVFGHYDQVTVVRSNPPGDRVFSACAVGKIVIWAVATKNGRPTAMQNIGSLDLVSFGSFNPVVQSLAFRVVPAKRPEQAVNVRLCS